MSITYIYYLKSMIYLYTIHSICTTTPLLAANFIYTLSFFFFLLLLPMLQDVVHIQIL